MKTTLLLAAASAALLTVVNTASADEPFLSPRAKAKQIRVALGSSASDVNLATNRPIARGAVPGRAAKITVRDSPHSGVVTNDELK